MGWTGAVRGLAVAAAVPAGAVWRSVQALASGRNAVLDWRVERLDTLVERDRLVQSLSRAAIDPGVAAICLRIDALPGSFGSSRDVRQALAQFRSQGKSVLVYLEQSGNAAYWLASVAERVFMTPAGEFGLVGVGVETIFLGGLFDKFGIEADFEAAGAYKSFGEPFTRRYASSANQEATNALISDLEAQMISEMAASRGLSEADIRLAMAEAPMSATEARDRGLVDQIAYADEFDAWIEERFGKKARRTPWEAWARRDRRLARIERWGEEPETVAVVHLEGPIVLDDKSGATRIRARSAAPLFDALRKDKRVRALVLHVNSPGGSALASDMIWREVDRFAKEKPVVACYEDVAASGGVYLSAPAAEIVVRPGTLTGSIGVFGGKLVLGGGLARFGVHSQTFGTSPNATVFSASRRFTDAQRERFRASLQRFYDGFVERVAAGRKVNIAAIEPHCRGRVWTGRAAVECGLVDRLGTLADAVERAARLAGLEPESYRRRDISIEAKSSLLSRILRSSIKKSRSEGAGLEAWEGRSFLGLLVRSVRRLWPMGDSAEVESLTEVMLAHPEQPLALLPMSVRAK